VRSCLLCPLAALFALLGGCAGDPQCPKGDKQIGKRCVDLGSIEEGEPEEPGAPPGIDAETIDSSDAASPFVCFLDWDRDGVGSGEEVDCLDPYAGLDKDSGPELEPPRVSLQDDDCDDEDPLRSPTNSELCDRVDNDCNGKVDDDARNACGGSCAQKLDHEPGEECQNDQQGACARTGTYVCDGQAAVTCNAPSVNASDELCADGIDNDCDGTIDEPNALDAPTWYQDCDGDGYAASTTGSIQSCARPANAGSCGWTVVQPQAATRTNWDCNDRQAAYSPDADFSLITETFTSWDFNCDGVLTPHPQPTPGKGGELFVCPLNMIGRLNNGTTSCDPSGKGSDGCFVWKGADGKYSDKPAAKCPDAAAYRISVSEALDPWSEDFNGYECSAHLLANHLWPCR
jgi:hypothetical protein